MQCWERERKLTNTKEESWNDNNGYGSSQGDKW